MFFLHFWCVLACEPPQVLSFQDAELFGPQGAGRKAQTSSKSCAGAMEQLEGTAVRGWQIAGFNRSWKCWVETSRVHVENEETRLYFTVDAFMDRITGGTVNFDVQYNEFVLKQEP